MVQCLIHRQATTPANAFMLRLNVSEQKKQLPYYMLKCVYLNYLGLHTDDKTVERKSQVREKNS